MQDAVEDQSRNHARKWKRPGSHFIERDAERKQIGPCVEFFATHLFRRHVGDCAHGPARVCLQIAVEEVHLGRNGRLAYRTRRRLPIRCEFRQAEVQYLRRTSIHKENVSGFDVAVDDTFGVGSFQTFGNLNGDVQQFG